ncbi:hypothetical protein FQR65_LT09165 [Abscondita terminalis]|nr:hypothetical protein FQR65_LT09165 [Abscondita terminalis]
MFIDTYIMSKRGKLKLFVLQKVLFTFKYFTKVPVKDSLKIIAQILSQHVGNVFINALYILASVLLFCNNSFAVTIKAQVRLQQVAEYILAEEQARHRPKINQVLDNERWRHHI